MSPKAAKLLEDALKLPPAARAAIAGSLIESLDEKVDESAEAEWRRTIARRVAEIESGTAKMIPWQQVRRRLRAK